ncbi:MAG TPA: thermonuclease family protein [Gaiellales bacterium]
MRILLPLIALVLLACAGCTVPGDSAPPATLTWHVSYVIDGDTIIVQLTGGDRVHVRLIGIDTPEISHSAGEASDCYGQAAARITRTLASDRDVELQVGRERHDRYGRLLAYVSIVGGPADLERRLLTLGAARTLTIPPNDDRADEYAGLAREARRAGRGLWGSCGSSS